jgi:EEF1A lysine methyltransferase 2
LQRALESNMTIKSQHWDHIFSNKTDQQLGWYEPSQAQTLKFISQCQLPQHYCVFIAGVGRSKLADTLALNADKLIVNDISQHALDEVKQRINSENLKVIAHDLSLKLDQPEYSKAVDLWIDRAVLHFLLEPQAIQQYFDNLRTSIKPDGYVLLAQFSKTGATQCAGLKIKQYDCDSLQQELGDGFELINSEDYIFTNPFGDEKPYVYALFKKRS